MKTITMPLEEYKSCEDLRKIIHGLEEKNIFLKDELREEKESKEISIVIKEKYNRTLREVLNTPFWDGYILHDQYTIKAGEKINDELLNKVSSGLKDKFDLKIKKLENDSDRLKELNTGFIGLMIKWFR